MERVVESREPHPLGTLTSMCLLTPSVLDHPLISARYFFPRSDALQLPTRVEVEGATLECWSRAPHQGAPTLVHFHGNGEVVADYGSGFGDLLVDAGLNVFFAEYRGYGGSTGSPSLVAMLDDVTAIFDAASSTSASIFVYGRSVGSIYAIEMAHRHPEIAGLILESGIADPLERVLLRVSPSELGVTQAAIVAEAERTLDHQAKLQSYPGPVLVLHARNDHLIDFTHGERLAGWAGERAELVCFDRGDHNSILAFNAREIVSRVAAFLDTVKLRGAP